MKNKNETNNKSSSYNIIWRFSERILAQLVTTVVTIILARILFPEDYGIISILMIFINICNILVTHSFSAALIQKKDADSTDFSSAFYLNIIITTIIYLTLFFTAPLIANLYGLPILKPLLRILGIRVPLTAINSIQSAYISKKMQFKKYFFATITGTVISAVAGITMALKGFGPWALVCQYLSNVFVDTVFLWFSAKWRPTKQFSIKKAFSLFKYGWKILVAALLDSSGVEVTNLLIGLKYSASDLAFFNKGKQYPQVINANVNESISSVMFPAMSLKQDKTNELKIYIQKALNIITYITYPVLLGFACVSEEFVLVLLTEKWLPVVPFIIIFCTTFLFTPIYSVNAQCIKAVGKSDRYLYISIAKFLLTIGLMIAAIPFGVIAVAVSGIISTAITTVFYTIVTKRTTGIGFFKQLSIIAPNLLLSFFMVLFIIGLKKIVVLPSVVMLVIEIIVGMAIYFGISYVLKYEPFFYLLNLAKKAFKRK